MYNFYRFAKRKLDEHVFLGNRLQVSYAPNYESLSDTKEKLEIRRNEVLVRSKSKCYPFHVYNECMLCLEQDFMKQTGLGLIYISIFHLR